MSEKIKNNKGGEGTWSVPNKGKVWNARTDGVDAPKEEPLKYEFYLEEDGFDSSKIDDSAEAKDRIVDFRERVVKRAGRLALDARTESLRKAV